MTLFDSDEVLLDFTIPWKPQVKERPRFGNGRVFTPTRTLKAEAAILSAFKEAQPDWTPYEGKCRVDWTFHNEFIGIKLLPWVDYENRRLRGDLDNYMKIASDALNGALYDDDRLIVATSAVKL